MTTIPVTAASRQSVPVATVVKAGLLAGVLDISATTLLEVVVLHDTTAVRLLQFVASGLLGPAALKGGLATAAVGLLVHFTIALTWATVFGLATTFVAPLGRVRTRRGIIAVGVAFGALVWVVMDFVVLPLAGKDPASPSGAGFWHQLGIHMVCVGLPIAAIVLRGRPPRS
jgi:hypothetical protein